VVAAWNVIGGGVIAMPVNPSGAPVTLPSSMAAQLQHRVGITGRLGAPGIFIAFTQGTSEFTGKPAIYQVGSGRIVKPSSAGTAQRISIAAAPSGRLWVFWKNGGRIFATRSNMAVTKFEPIQKIAAPGGSSVTVFDLAGEGSLGPLDILALAQPASGAVADYHQRVLPTLVLRAKAGRAGKTVFSVTDAGDPVKAAIIKVQHRRRAATDKTGTATLRLGHGKHAVTATKTGYAKVSLSLHVR
jgi:hypothetical protein